MISLKTYMREIVSSEVEDWTLFSFEDDVKPASQKLAFGQLELNSDRKELSSHPYAASFKKNLSISLAWGLESNDDFRESWANSFPDPKASSGWLDFFYNGVLVLREIFVTVDGGRCFLPLPDREISRAFSGVEKLTTQQTKAELFQLINSLTSTYEFDSYMDRAGIGINANFWPE